MNTIVLIVIVVLVVAAIVAAILLLRRRQHVKAFRDKGWEFVTSPDETVAYGLNVPPFGLGIGRRFDDLVRGELDGWQFQVFEYRFKGFDENRVTTIALPRPLGEFHLQSQPGGPSVITSGESEAWVATVQQALQPVLPQITAGPSTQLSIDGNHVVLLDTPAKAADMEAHIRRAIAAAQVLANPALTDQQWPQPARQLGFHRTDWQYQPRHDHALSVVRHDTDGYDHRAVNVITGPNDGLPFTALEHRWKTKEIERDSDGKEQTTVKYHTEYLMEVAVPFPFHQLSVNWGVMSGGEKQGFESITFDKMFAVRSREPKFAHDVLHPRMMQWMEAMGETRFSIDRGRWVWQLKHLDQSQIQWMADYCHTFFAQVPTFVWADLGVAQQPQFRQPA